MSDFNPEKFKKYLEDRGRPEEVPQVEIVTKPMAAMRHDKNPVIKDMMAELEVMKQGDWDSLTPQQKASLRRQVWQK